MKLTKIVINNFLSIKNLSIDLENVEHQVLFGKNASGKSNILEAIRFFYGINDRSRKPFYKRIDKKTNNEKSEGWVEFHFNHADCENEDCTFRYCQYKKSLQEKNLTDQNSINKLKEYQDKEPRFFSIKRQLLNDRYYRTDGDNAPREFNPKITGIFDLSSQNTENFDLNKYVVKYADELLPEEEQRKKLLQQKLNEIYLDAKRELFNREENKNQNKNRSLFNFHKSKKELLEKNKQHFFQEFASQCSKNLEIEFEWFFDAKEQDVLYRFKKNGVEVDVMNLSGGEFARIMHILYFVKRSQTWKSNVLIQTSQTGPKMLIPFFIADEPESHLHPQIQTNCLKLYKELFTDFLKEFQPNKFDEISHQKTIVATHSPSLVAKYVQEYGLEVLSHVNMKDGQTIIKNLKKNQTRKIKKHQINDALCHALFAEKILLVEGPGDEWGVRILLKKFSKIDAEKLNTIHILHIGGGDPNSFLNFAQLFQDLNIDFFVLFDDDEDKLKYKNKPKRLSLKSIKWQHGWAKNIEDALYAGNLRKLATKPNKTDLKKIDKIIEENPDVLTKEGNINLKNLNLFVKEIKKWLNKDNQTAD